MNNYNQYGSYPYYNNYMYNQYPSYQSQQQYYQQNQQKQKALPLVYVNGLVGAKAYIVAPNEKIYLKDSESNLMFVKTANQEGVSNIEAFELMSVSLEDINKPSSQKQQEMQFAKESDLFALRDKFMGEIDKLSNSVKMLLGSSKKEEI